MTGPIIITLPWPNKALSPTTRTHWSTLAKAKAAYRANCGWLTKLACVGSAKFQLEAPLPVAVTFNPPDNRRRDTDNMLASVKSGLDGVADVIGVDDCHWQLMLTRGPVIRGGAVVVSVGATHG